MNWTIKLLNVELNMNKCRRSIVYCLFMYLNLTNETCLILLFDDDVDDYDDNGQSFFCLKERS